MGWLLHKLLGIVAESNRLVTDPVPPQPVDGWDISRVER